MPNDDKTREALEVAMNALARIAESDPGPSYYIAKSALSEVRAMIDTEGKDAD